MTLRIRRALLLLLTLCLVGAQTAAYAHAISHLGVDTPATSAAAKSHAASLTADHLEGFCLECLAFAQVTGSAHGTAPQALFDAPPTAAQGAPVVHQPSARAFAAFDARAPPELPTR